MALPGPSTARPAGSLGPYAATEGAEFYGQTLGFLIKFAGGAWRNSATGRGGVRDRRRRRRGPKIRPAAPLDRGPSLRQYRGRFRQDYLVDGVTESLTTDLSQMSGMRVIGRNTAFSYKDKALDLKQIGRELNIRCVLEGSVQRSTNRIRVNVQLIDAKSGDHLWAERFDKTVADLFDMQDEIVACLANALNTQPMIAEARRAERAPSPDSMDLYFQGMSAYKGG